MSIKTYLVNYIKIKRRAFYKSMKKQLRKIIFDHKNHRRDTNLVILESNNNK